MVKTEFHYQRNKITEFR